jgi:serine/threonine protein kinase
MDLIEGEPLSRHLCRGLLPLSLGLRWVAQIASAVHYAHKCGIVHRDLKPENIMITNEGKPVVVDFGLAKFTRADANLILQEGPLGTPAYMAPEQIVGEPEEVGPRSDVYSLGAVLYEILTGRPTVDGRSSGDILQKVLAEDPIPPRMIRPDLPPQVEAICLKALDKEPARRFASACDFEVEIRRFLHGGGAGRTSWFSETCRAICELPLLLGLAIFLLFGLLVGLALLMIFQVEVKSSG